MRNTLQAPLARPHIYICFFPSTSFRLPRPYPRTLSNPEQRLQPIAKTLANTKNFSQQQPLQLPPRASTFPSTNHPATLPQDVLPEVHGPPLRPMPSSLRPGDPTAAHSVQLLPQRRSDRRLPTARYTLSRLRETRRGCLQAMSQPGGGNA